MADTQHQPSEYDRTPVTMSQAELDAAALRAAARRQGEPEPPFGTAYTGSEGSKRSRMPWR